MVPERYPPGLSIAADYLTCRACNFLNAESHCTSRPASRHPCQPCVSPSPPRRLAHQLLAAQQPYTASSFINRLCLALLVWGPLPCTQVLWPAWLCGGPSCFNQLLFPPHPQRGSMARVALATVSWKGSHYSN
jgi:hypothetical protein